MLWPFRKKCTPVLLPANCDDLAVVLIDMQESFVCRLRGKVLTRLVNTQSQVIRDCASKNLPVIVLEYHGDGKTIKEITDALVPVQRKITIIKRHKDGFERTMLDQTLQDFGINTLVLMGIYAHSCVLSTAQSALEKGYQVMTSEHLIADSNSDEILAESRNWYIENKCFHPFIFSR